MPTPEKTLTLLEKIHAIQSEMGPITKGQVNPHFRNSYFDINDLIAALKPHLTKYRLAFVQLLGFGEGQNFLESRIQDVDSGDEMISRVLIPTGLKAQEMAATLTYYKRIQATAMWLIAGEEDDDGNKATAAPVAASQPLPGLTKSGAPTAAAKRVESFQESKADAELDEYPVILLDEDEPILAD